MNAKNIAICATSIIFMILFWGIYEVWKSAKIIATLTDPQSSTERGFEKAEQDFHRKSAHFLYWRMKTPGVTINELEKHKDYEPYLSEWCGFRSHVFEEIALKAGSYEYNEYYVLAYNTRLLTLINGK